MPRHCRDAIEELIELADEHGHLRGIIDADKQSRPG
jgi:hypothetical protein